MFGARKSGAAAGRSFFFAKGKQGPRKSEKENRRQVEEAKDHRPRASLDPDHDDIFHPSTSADDDAR